MTSSTAKATVRRVEARRGEDEGRGSGESQDAALGSLCAAFCNPQDDEDEGARQSGRVGVVTGELVSVSGGSNSCADPSHEEGVWSCTRIAAAHGSAAQHGSTRRAQRRGGRKIRKKKKP